MGEKPSSLLKTPAGQKRPAMKFGVLQLFSWPERRIKLEEINLDYLPLAPLSHQSILIFTEKVLPHFQ